MEGLTEGRIVHYVLSNGQHCAAMVVRVFENPSGYVNLELHPDSDAAGTMNHAIAIGDRWRTSIKYSEEPEPNSWHWIERA